jgi:hypothetical protein
MKGITAVLRDLEVGEQIEVTDMKRPNLYMLARRVGIKVSVEKYIGGFFVTRLPDGPLTHKPVVHKLQSPPVGSENGGQPLESTPVDEKQAKLAALRGLIASVEEKPAVKEPQTGFWDESAWIEDPVTYENGDICYWHHQPKGKPMCYRRESNMEAA